MTSDKSFFQRRIIDPIMALLRSGATPERLSWSLAAGFVIGLNPLIGSTTLVALAAASIFRLNYVASQLANHAAYPLEVLLLPVFIALGNKAFHAPPMPVAGKALLAAARAHPWETTKWLWTWEWHALVVWAALAAVLLPVLRFALCRLLTARLRRNEAGKVALET